MTTKRASAVEATRLRALLMVDEARALEQIGAALEGSGGMAAAAAKLLGISPRTFARLFTEFPDLKTKAREARKQRRAAPSEAPAQGPQPDTDS